MAGSGTGGQQMAGSGMRCGTGARRWRDLRGGAARLVQLGSSIGDNRDANSLVALELHSGRRVWAQQLVHHDLWDAKLPAGCHATPSVYAVGGKQYVGIAAGGREGMEALGETWSPIRSMARARRWFQHAVPDSCRLASLRRVPARPATL
ncbi:hypothetical protein K8O61_04655 [Xanthomonas cerealis pv. cerealis]|uniref:hypothetical protein n=1 Tax=Xanthomonas cerealis TaxID=3390025 RepID=UPI001F1F2A40|nr:hypothetical protein [Xanthomonas translucens]UKE71442.1 hypothetical protein K8O61_04655 [Xanthomonas translucens pv. pistacia]